MNFFWLQKLANNLYWQCRGTVMPLLPSFSDVNLILIGKLGTSNRPAKVEWAGPFAVYPLAHSVYKLIF